MADENKPFLKVRQEQGIVTVQFNDAQLLDEAHIMQVQTELMALVDAAERPLMLIDFHNVDQLSSACLGALLAVHKRVKEKKGQLRLANIQPKLMKIFQITLLDKVLRISATRTGAMSVLQRVAKEGGEESP